MKIYYAVCTTDSIWKLWGMKLSGVGEEWRGWTKEIIKNNWQQDVRNLRTYVYGVMSQKEFFVWRIEDQLGTGWWVWKDRYMYTGGEIIALSVSFHVLFSFLGYGSWGIFCWNIWCHIVCHFLKYNPAFFASLRVQPFPVQPTCQQRSRLLIFLAGLNYENT